MTVSQNVVDVLAAFTAVLYAAGVGWVNYHPALAEIRDLDWFLVVIGMILIGLHLATRHGAYFLLHFLASATLFGAPMIAAVILGRTAARRRNRLEAEARRLEE
jgi:hypothetical protein